MAGEHDDYLSGVLDGRVDLTASDREKQAQTEIGTEIAVNRVLAATQAMFPTPGGAQPAQIAAATSGPGGYRFDPQTISDRIKDWQEVLDDIANDNYVLERAREALAPPSGDKPAARNVEATSNSIQAAINQNAAMQQYAQAWIDALSKANGTYTGHERETAINLNTGASATDGHNLNSP